MSAYDITGFLRTEYRPIAYCVPSEKTEYCTLSNILLGQADIASTHSCKFKEKMTHTYKAGRKLLILGYFRNQTIMRFYWTNSMHRSVKYDIMSNNRVRDSALRAYILVVFILLT